MDFTTIINHLEAATIAYAVLGAAALYAQVSFARWAAPKVARVWGAWRRLAR